MRRSLPAVAALACSLGDRATPRAASCALQGRRLLRGVPLVKPSVLLLCHACGHQLCAAAVGYAPPLRPLGAINALPRGGGPPPRPPPPSPGA